MSRPLSLRVALLAAALLSACETAAPRPWLRLSAAGSNSFHPDADGRLRQDLGKAGILIDLGKKETRIAMTVENRGSNDLELRAGAEGASTTAAIGEVWCRPIGAASGEDVPAAVPYRAKDLVVLHPGWNAVFLLDSPLGRDLVLGQQLLFTVETRDPATGLHDHLSLPLIATNVPTAK